MTEINKKKYLKKVSQGFLKPKRSQGFLIIEVLLAVVILTMVFLTLFSTLSFLTNRTKRSTFDTQASSLMQQGMEQTRSSLVSHWTKYKAGNYYPVFNSSTNSWELQSGDDGLLQGRFTRTITISDVCRDPNSQGVQSDCGVGVLDVQSKKITEHVSWTDATTTKDATATLLVFKSK